MTTAVLVNTCQKYHYIVPCFLGLLNRYWHNISFPIYVSTTGTGSELEEHKRIKDFRIINTEIDPGVLQAKLYGIEKIPEKLIILLQEDFLIERYVDDDLLKKIERIMTEREDIGCIRLMPSPQGTGITHHFYDVKLVEIKKDAMYSFSFQVAIWRKSFLVKVMKDFLGIKKWEPDDRLDQMIEINLLKHIFLKLIYLNV